MRKDGIDDVYQFIEKLKKEKVPLDKAEQQLKNSTAPTDMIVELLFTTV